MPEGPSIVILREEVKAFCGKTVMEVSGNSRQDIARAKGKKVIAFRSWGKHFLICFKGFTIRIHFMLFGSYRINEDKETPPRLTLRFKDGFVNFYACSVKLIDEPLESVYDWSEDIMAPEWDAAAAVKKLKLQPEMQVTDALLDQHIFSGAGNIIKNEVLFRTRIHPENMIGGLPARKITQLVKETHKYAFEFLEWKKQYVLKKHWLAHTKKFCAQCGGPLTKKYLGRTNRRTFYCEECQKLYPAAAD